jgi:hypothetical protein
MVTIRIGKSLNEISLTSVSSASVGQLGLGPADPVAHPLQHVVDDASGSNSRVMRLAPSAEVERHLLEVFDPRQLVLERDGDQRLDVLGATPM